MDRRLRVDCIMLNWEHVEFQSLHGSFGENLRKAPQYVDLDTCHL